MNKYIATAGFYSQTIIFANTSSEARQMAKDYFGTNKVTVRKA